MGFFAESRVMSKDPMQINSIVPKCGACGLYKLCNSPKMPASGKGKKRILIIGEAPGRHEDEEGIQFIGEAGKQLARSCTNVGINLRKDCIITNALICRPPGNRTPKQKEILYCRPNLTKTIKEHDPDIIIPLGGTAVNSLLMGMWKEDIGKIGKWVGWQIPSQELNAWICPNYHPSFVIRAKDKVVELLFERHLEAAVNLDGKPWDKPPDYESKVKCILEPNLAADYINKLMKTGRPLAFDYETNMLKPDSDESEIVCCSVSDGRTSVAFPWYGKEIKRAMRKFLRSPVPKWGANIKYEERWTRKEFGFGVKSWDHDVVNGMHVIDNRPRITGVKFQSFVLLGAKPYNEHIEKYLKSKDKGGNSKNRIREIEFSDLLIYCGLDSLFEWQIAKIQKQMLGFGGKYGLLQRPKSR